MVEYMLPFTRHLNLEDGTISDAVAVQTRRLADLKGLFADSQAEAALMDENPVLYEVYVAADNPAVVGSLGFSTTIIRPGKVGSEYFFTKGHYHALGDRAELYYGLLGEGYLLLQTPEGEISLQKITPGVLAYVPPHQGHRTINTGKSNFVFLACYPADAGYDYASIAEKGFASLLIEQDGEPTLIPNPRWEK